MIFKIISIFFFYIISMNCFGNCGYRSILEDGDRGFDVKVEGDYCYNGEKISKPGKGEYSIFGKNGDGGNLYIGKGTEIFGGNLESGKGANSYIGINDSKSGDIYNNGSIYNATLDTSNSSKSYFGSNNTKGGSIYNQGSIYNSPINNDNNSKTYFGRNNSTGGGGIYNDELIINNNILH